MILKKCQSWASSALKRWDQLLWCWAIPSVWPSSIWCIQLSEQCQVGYTAQSWAGVLVRPYQRLQGTSALFLCFDSVLFVWAAIMDCGINVICHMRRYGSFLIESYHRWSPGRPLVGRNRRDDRSKTDISQARVTGMRYLRWKPEPTRMQICSKVVVLLSD